MTFDDRASAWLARLLDDHGAALVLYARQWCSTPEDVVQEALLELVSQRQRPDSPVAHPHGCDVLLRMADVTDRPGHLRQCHHPSPVRWITLASSVCANIRRPVNWTLR